MNPKHLQYALLVFFVSASSILADAKIRSLWMPKTYKNARVSSVDTTKGNDDFIAIPKGKTVTIADLKGPGVITHLWMTQASKDPFARKNLILCIYWDNHPNPSVEVPIGEFFGQGWGEEYIMNSALLVAAPKKGKAMNSYIPMPFSQAARIELRNESDEDITNFYYYVDYEKWNKEIPSKLRFFARWSRKITFPNTKSQRENEWGLLGATEKTDPNPNHYFTVLQTVGKGHFLGLNLFIDSPTPLWYGEGDDRIVIDGEANGSVLLGTGTEDVFNTAWSPKEVFHHPFFGSPRVSDSIGWLGRTHLYRFWLESPIVFEKNFLFQLEHGHANSLTLDLISVAYWYQGLENFSYQALPAKEFRKNQPEIQFRQIHKWRDSFRSEKGNGEIWGHE